LRRNQVLSWFAKVSPCLIGMEACGTANHRARELTALGHTVRLIPPAYAKPYVRRNENDAADARAICEAVGRPSMRFVPIKTVEQQAGTVTHKARRMLIKQQTMTQNSLRSLMVDSASSSLRERNIYASCSPSWPIPRTAASPKWRAPR